MATDNGAAPPFVEKSEAYQKALAFLQNADAKEGTDYGWVLDYAKSLWEYRNKTFSSLDEKAEGIIKYLGGGTGLFAIGALAKVDASNTHIMLSSLPAIVAALAAIFIALWSKKPGPFPGIPTVQIAKEEYADVLKDGKAAIAAFLGQWNRACEAARLICEQKARLIEWAAKIAYIALVLLIVPVVVSIGWPPSAAKPPSSAIQQPTTVPISPMPPAAP